MSLLLALTASGGAPSGVISWTEQNDVYALSGTSSAVTTPNKIGGDDVPRVEIWEKRKSKKHDGQLDKLIRDAYDKITGKTPAEIKEILAEEETPEIVQAIPVYDDEDDEEILLLLVI